LSYKSSKEENQKQPVQLVLVEEAAPYNEDVTVDELLEGSFD
jgi:hypothetical protein